MTQAWTFNHLGTEVLRIDSSGNVGIGTAPVTWTSEPDLLDSWRIYTRDLAILTWLDSQGVRRCEQYCWQVTGELYAMFLLRWGDCRE